MHFCIHKKSIDVTILNRQAFLLSRQLDSDAAEIVQRKIEAMGVRVLSTALLLSS